MLITLKTDIRPPIAPVLGSPAVLSTTSISVPLSVAASDPSGVASYALEYSTELNGTYVVATNSAVFPQTVTDLAPGTTYFFRARATDNYGNVGPYSGIVSATTQSITPQPSQTWPAHVPGYVSLIPEVGGYGMNTVAGSGRHLATPATTVILVNSLATGNTGGALTGLGANVFGGTFEYAWRHAASPKVIIPVVGGWITIQDSILNQSAYVSYYGQFAPSTGLYFRGTKPEGGAGGNMAIWHMRSYMGDDVTGLGAGARDCFSSGNGLGTTQQVVLINCEFAWSVDEVADFNRSHSQLTFVNCAFIEPLHLSTVVHPEDGPGVDHGFGPIVGGDTGQPQTTAVSTFRNLWAHTTGRNPLISSATYVHANNLHYNHGRPTGGAGNGVQIIGAGATGPNFANILGNGFVRGPNNNTSMVSVTAASTLPAGSAGYSFANCQFGWTAPANQNAFFTSSPSGYAASSVQTAAYPGSWGTGLSAVLQWAANPLAPTLTEWSNFVTLMDRTVGAQPRFRTTQYGRVAAVFNQIRDRLNGVTQTDQFVDTVTEAGGWFTVPSVTINPANPGSHWHAPLPTGSDRDTPHTSGTFSNGQSRVGYTRLEEWAYEQHLYVTSIDSVAPSIPTGVTATAQSQTTIRIAWSASTDTGGSGLGGYRVYQATASGGPYTQIGGNLSAATLSFDDTTLTAATTRYYRVTSFDLAGNESNTSSTVSATTYSITVARLPFSDSFESGNTGTWDVTAGSMPVTTAEAYIGSRSSMITAPGGGVANDNYLEYNFGDAVSVAGTPTGMNDLWIRVAHKWSSNWQDNGYASVQKVFLLNIHNPATGARRYQLTFNIWTPSLQYFVEFLRWQEGGAANGNATPNIDLGITRVLGQWVEFVFRVRMNTPGTSDGILQIWSKSQGATSYVQRVNRTDVNYRDSTTFSPNRLIQSNYQPDGIPSGTRYWDAWLLQQEAIDVTGSSTAQFVPNRWVSASATGSGNGLSAASPWTFAQAIANASPGNIIQLAGGTYVGSLTGAPRSASFNISRAGTASQPIIWVAQNYAALTTSNRTQLTNNGVFGTNSCPVIGITGAHNHVYGLYIYEPQANPGYDTGSFYISTSAASNIKVRYCHMDRASVSNWAVPVDTASNTCGMFIEPGVGVEISDNKFTNYTTTSSVSYGKAPVLIFSSTNPPYCQDILFQNNTIENCNLFIYVKGAEFRPVLGNIRLHKNLVQLTQLSGDQHNYLINFSDTGNSAGDNVLTQNLVIGGHMLARGHYQSNDSNLTRGMVCVNNTCINFRPYDDHGVFYTIFGVTSATPASHRFHNNIHYNVTAGGVRMYTAGGGGPDAAWLSCDHNTAWNSQATGISSGTWAATSADPNETLQAYRARTGRDQNSNIRDPLLVSATYGNAQFGHLQSGSAERNAGVDILNLLGQGASAAINRGCFITPDMSDIIGIRPLT